MRSPAYPLPRLLPAASAICLALSLSACGAKAGKETPPVVVGVMTVKTEAVPLVTDLSGRTEASLVAEVRPQVSGIITDRLFTEGSMVRAGQPLYQIDSRLYAASAQQARAAVATAEATVEANRLKAERYRLLAAEGGVSKQDAADARATYNQSRAQVAANRAALASSQVSLGFTRVTSPITGRIGRSSVTKGALVTASQADPLSKVQRLDPMFVNIQQSSNDFMALRRSFQKGALAPVGTVPVRIVLADGSEYPVEGRLSFADVDVNADSGTVTLRATVANPQGVLLPGLFVRARLVQASVPQGILVPQQAITRAPRGGASVLLVNAKGEVETRDVTADTAVGDKWLVTAGLKAGEKVIVDGLMKARPGAKVKAVPADTVPAQQTAK
ncbi:efflux RND transporter periplasmic adaptor subunit [Novosphingobium sp. KCTC 2891]|uniref:efflux RND transporter periplasmic adaptor subunit n=1 Tax=Novosphingobium sp. KCTC 2891 TaxID=2989730 RepID=UPI002222FABB|nr:efflux RND transporter periplasmic adaptor subunit [Novosphingobium sp. KCTC 2891]MCW1381370.1 efflux RND transporter periplasmic adaptor subunit [Novosphingobium sp. KCTC 2891]